MFHCLCFPDDYFVLCCAIESSKTLVLNEVEIEELSLTFVDTSLKTLVLNEVKISSLSWKRLTLLSCGSYRNPMDMKISVTNLLSLTWSCRKESKLALEDVPKLNVANESNDAKFVEYIVEAWTVEVCATNDGGSWRARLAKKELAT
ncbi:hypothetical protein ACFE04_013954 [Oxalis oulophora]